MDCKTARLLLDYARPHPAELDSAESGRFEEHLSACEGCDQLARGERLADEAVGKAMRQVDVPDHFARILARLNEMRGDKRRRWVVYGLRGAIAAAAVLLLAPGCGAGHGAPGLPRRTAGDRREQPRHRHAERPRRGGGPQKSGRDDGGAGDLNYSRLRGLFLTNVQGRQTPMLIFNKTSEDVPSAARLVFLLADDQFDLNALPQDPRSRDANAYEYQCATAVLHPPAANDPATSSITPARTGTG